ncbi:MAG: RNA polymerase sigma-70 factor ECF subfamily [Spirochaetes bacterium]|nr:MAG: RNA polymerase sigma-70 factor ECF subfamily [Spirochaetota bacterium]
MLSFGGQEGDIDFRKLYEANGEMLLRIAFRIANSTEAAEDVVQEAFGKLIEKRMSFPTPNDAKYWLIRVVKNAAINYAKRKSRETKAYEKWWRNEASPIENQEAGSFSIKETGTEAGVQASAEEDVLKDESAAEIRKALSMLPEKLKMVLILKEYGGMNYKEIGKILGISEGNVKVRAFRAREALLAKMDKENGHVSR